MTVLDILKKYAITRKQLSHRFNIPMHTVNKWCAPDGSQNHRDCPDYVVEMIDLILENQFWRHDKQLKITGSRNSAKWK